VINGLPQKGKLMRRDEIADLMAFAVVAEERSFTKAAMRLGMAQSALSQIVRRVEEHLGLRLLSRTTRSVAPTEAGERLLATLGPMLRDLDTVIGSLGELRDRPTGTIRITTVEHAAKTILMPAMKQLLASNPDIHVEINVDHALVDIVAGQFDAGIRLGGEIAKDMIAVRLGPDIPMAIVAAPAYLARCPAPTRPTQLIDHRLINFRLPTSGTVIGWRLIRDGREVKVRGQGQLIVNTIELLIDAVLDGHGLAYIHLDQVQSFVDSGSLVRVLSKYTPDLPGYHLYYPNRRHPSSAFSLLVETLRYFP
jgi:DNA-binding transcriptional LysR family regulator